MLTNRNKTHLKTSGGQENPIANLWQFPKQKAIYWSCVIMLGSYGNGLLWLTVICLCLYPNFVPLNAWLSYSPATSWCSLAESQTEVGLVSPDINIGMWKLCTYWLWKKHSWNVDNSQNGTISPNVIKNYWLLHNENWSYGLWYKREYKNLLIMS